MAFSRGEPAEQTAPRRVAGVRIADLPLTPEDAFVWSQLDGITTVREVGELTGIGLESVLAIVARLQELGAVQVEAEHTDRSASQRPPRPSQWPQATSQVPAGRPPGRSSSRPDPRREPSEARRAVRDIRRESSSATPRVEVAGPAAHARPQPRTPKPSPREPARKPSPQPAAAPESFDDSNIDLDDDQKRRIDSLYDRLEAMNHYQVLGVPRDADKSAIKASYYQLITVYHPDKFFRKTLGSYKRKLEKIFERLTDAQEVLTRKSTRAEYDRYLHARRATRAFDAVLSSIPPPPPPSRPPGELKAQRAPTASRSAPEPEPEPERPAAPVGDVASAPVETNRQAVARVAPALSAQERGQALARKLAGGRVARREKAQALSPDAAADLLKRFVAERRTGQVDKFVQAGREAIAEKSWISAVNALRIALTLSPDDDEVRGLYDQAEAQAAGALAESYEARAKYEEDNDNWDAAGQSWERVAGAKKDQAEPFRRAAQCYARGTDPKKGIGPAREAVRLTPNGALNRVTLAKLYAQCGMVASAVGEVKRALELKPGDPELKQLMAELKATKS